MSVESWFPPPPIYPFSLILPRSLRPRPSFTTASLLLHPENTSRKRRSAAARPAHLLFYLSPGRFVKLGSHA